MPIDTEMYKGIIKRLSPEQAKKLAERMDRQSASRGLFGIIMLVSLIGFMVALFAIAKAN